MRRWHRRRGRPGRRGTLRARLNRRVIRAGHEVLAHDNYRTISAARSANLRSNSFSTATRLKTVFFAANVVREYGNGGVSDNFLPTCKSSATRSSTMCFRNACTNVFTVTYWATLLEIALIIGLVSIST